MPLPSPLPDQIDKVEQTLLTSDIEDSGSGSEAKQQEFKNSQKSMLKPVSEENQAETSLVNKSEMDQDPEKAETCSTKETRSRKLKLYAVVRLKKIVWNVVISAAVFCFFIFINFLTNGKIMNIGLEKSQQTNNLPASYAEKLSQLQGTTVTASNKTQLMPTSFEMERPTELDIGTHMYLDTVFLTEKGKTLFFKHINSDLEGFKRDSVHYNNGYFTIKTSGYYFVHGLLTISTKFRPTNVTEEPVKFHYCLEMNGFKSRTICRRRKEQAGWIGTVDIVESRLYLRKDEKIKVTVSDMSYVYGGVYDTTFSIRLIQPHQK